MRIAIEIRHTDSRDKNWKLNADTCSFLKHGLRKQ